MTTDRPDFRWAAKIRPAAALCLAGAVVGAGLYFSNLIYLRAGYEAARAAAARQLAAERQATAERLAAGRQATAERQALASCKGAAECQATTTLAFLLSQSSSDRDAINQAWTNAGNCTALSQDQQAFQQAAASRQSLISQLNGIPGLTSLPAAMVSDLTGAWQASQQVDQDYAQWASDENASGCTTNDPSYAAANGPNATATADKTAFTSLWNPLAQHYGLPTYDQSQI